MAPRDASPLVDLHVRAFVRDGRRILDDVRWTMGAGEHWVLLGANGSGKSTLLSIVAGYEWPSEGWVRVLGEEYGRCDMPALKRRIGLVSARLFDWLPPRQRAVEVAATGLYAEIGAWRTLGDADLEAGRAALARIGAEAIADAPYGVLSQGEKQRVMIARSLVRAPELLILDEPCAGLDPVARERFLADVGSVCAAPGGPSLLLVTHHVEEVRPPVGHALLLREGRVVASGALETALRSETLSRTFGVPVVLEGVAAASGYRLRVGDGIDPSPDA